MMCNLWYPKAILLFLLCGALSAQRSNHVHRMLLRNRGCHGVFYAGLGCFSTRPPFNNTSWRPQRPSFVDTTFLLYTRRNPTVNQTLNADIRSSITASNFNVSQPVKILVHGFLQHGRVPFLINMTRALLDVSPMNVIVVNWGQGALFPYTMAVANTRVVGAEIAKLIRVLVQVTGLSTENVHIIGHSLGAHVAGYAGARTPGLGRISALDPAQPNFSGFGPEVCLDKSDANLVDVIHTDALPYDTVRGYGMIHSVGHIDFYPNGGHHQPGCHEETSIFGFMQDALDRGMINAEVGLSCSHERSTQLFTNSITRPSSPCTFQAVPCDSEQQYTSGQCLHCGNRPCPIMGYHADKSFGARGTFYLNTTASEPFCGHHFFLTLDLSPSMDSADGTISVKLTGPQGESRMTPIKTGQFNPGDVVTGFIVEEANLGEIFSVEVHFQQTSGYFTYSTQQVILRKVKVDNVMRMHTKYFCQSGMTIDSTQKITLDSGSFDQSICP
ncbi:pancreatic lipase-related protein 2 [Aplysia californica]|uniref:Pancreatic lipase-related protein 2 n=1 Tax=Aplysia californica TaxID=6500 RepID=A0ABM0ZYG3_APLCA|nr:pancreatic lipase-related protein 2 [Aplysia californica]